MQKLLFFYREKSISLRVIIIFPGMIESDPFKFSLFRCKLLIKEMERKKYCYSHVDKLKW
ncbi:hypothetical protein AM592_17735 [Bacillus gobiensis]|uniref:Uncharacterized protein n=2 Tax=Bacillus TaxID=1386 RepID=A0A0M4FT74_9BACI|nr:hypothetical protein AM592_17735 [Bacillus gobiensis]MBP1082285.1 hypothetical protein [Bacillus capparidis]